MNTLTRTPNIPVTAMVQQLLRSPQLPLVVQEFQSVLQVEREKRARL